MKVALVGVPTHPDWPGGEPAIVRSLFDGLNRRGVSLERVDCNDLLRNAPGSAALRKLSTGFYSYSFYRRKLAEISPDVVLGFTDLDSSYLRAAEDLRIPVVATSHIYWTLCPKWDLFDWRGKICLGPGFPKCAICTLSVRVPPWVLNTTSFASQTRLARTVPSAIIAPSHFVARKLVSSGHDPGKVIVIPNGIDRTRFSYTEFQATGKVLYAGQATLRKGFGIFLEVSRRLADHGLEFLCTGEPTGPTEDYGSIRCLGTVPEFALPELFASAQLVVVPSLWDEPFGLVVAQAMAVGRPVIASAVGAIPEQITHGQTGFLVRAGDLAQLTDTIAEVSGDPRLCQRVGLAASMSSEGYSAQTMTERYLDVLARYA